MRVAYMGVALVGAVAAAGWWLASPKASEGLLAYTNAAVVAKGEEYYAEYCAGCHGTNLEGEENWQTRDTEGFLPAPPHDENGHTWHHPDQQLIAITAYGTEQIVGNGYKSRMEGYSNRLTEAQIIAVLSYIKSRWPPKVIRQHNQINAEAEKR